jgi:hypothetical protein
MITKKCWICGQIVDIKDYKEHNNEHYEKGNQRRRYYLIDMPIQKQEKPFNPIKGLEKL